MELIEKLSGKFELIEAATASKPTRIKCKTMAVCDVPTENNRLYPRDIWSREVNRLQGKISTGQLLGAIDHPTDGKDKINDSAIRWTRIMMEGARTLGEGEILPTQGGRDLEALIKSGIEIGVSSRGHGTTTTKLFEGKSCDVVGDDFMLWTFDAVRDPAVAASQLRLESVQKKALTVEQRRMQVLAGVAGLSESYPFFQDSADGVTHANDLDIDHQKHAVDKRPTATPEFRKLLVAAILAQKKQTVEAILPISESEWVVWSMADHKLLRVSFRKNADATISIDAVTDNVEPRHVGEAHDILPAILVESVFRDNKELMVRLAGVGR